MARYEAKEEGFCPGGATLHSMMTPHGPDNKCFEDWTEKQLGPIKVKSNSIFTVSFFKEYILFHF